jgi:hypothetical protein
MALEITENKMAEPILPEMQDITRQREMAKLLLQKGLTDNLQGQMVSGRYVGASPWQGIANIYSAYKGRELATEADRKQQELAEMLRAEGDKDLMAYGEAVTPKPAVEGGIYGPDNKLTTQTTADMFGANMELNPQYKEVAAQAAVEPDYATGMRILRKSKDPETRQLAKLLMADQMKTLILPEGSTAIRGSLFGKGGQTIQGAPKETTDFKNYEKAREGGFLGTFNDWLTSQKKAGATNVSVGGAKDLAGQVGDISKESRISAMGAVQSADSANRIIQAVDSNKLFTGVGANQRLTAAQIADGLGLGGKDTAEKIANSRQAIQGLAQLTLQGRKQMRGEGAITESEGALAQRAMSGEITLTGPEIRQLAEAAKRSAKFQYSQHQNIINTMKSRPDTRDLVPFYDVPADVSIFNPRAVGGQSSVKDAADAIIRGQ